MQIGPLTIGRQVALTESDVLRRASIIQEAAELNNEVLRERLAELELALEDQGWLRVAADGAHEFSPDGLRKIRALSRINYIKNPLINRAVTLQASYVFGQGINIGSKDKATNDFIQAFMDDPMNKAELTSHQSRILKEIDLEVLGNIYFVFFADASSDVKVRTIPVDEIDDIICSPEDSKEPWYYKRSWSRRTFNVTNGEWLSEPQTDYYPDWRYEPAARLMAIAGRPIHWESPVYHVKVGGMSGWKYGVPETYAALDWAKAYKEFLEDWSSIVRAYARFAWSLTVTGGRSGVAAAKTRLGTTLGIGNGGETNPAPVAGATFITTPGQTMEPIRTSGATTSAEDGRRLLLMVAAATGWPESFFGDVSVGTLATAKSLDRPSELKMLDRQTLWVGIHQDILEYARRKKGLVGGTDRAMKVEGGETPNIDVGFPPLLEHDVAESVKAIVMAATLDGKADAGILPMEHVAKLLLDALGEDDIDEILKGMDFAASVAVPVAPAVGQNPVTAAEAIMLEAAKELQTAIRSERGKRGT